MPARNDAIGPKSAQEGRPTVSAAFEELVRKMNEDAAIEIDSRDDRWIVIYARRLITMELESEANTYSILNGIRRVVCDRLNAIEQRLP